MVTTAFQVVLVLVMLALFAASVWCARKHPKYFFIGALLGAVLLSAMWGAMGTLAVVVTAKPTGAHTMAETTAPAWSLFMDVLWRAAILGAMLGGVALTFLLGDFGDEAESDEADGKPAAKPAGKPSKPKAK